MTTQDVSKKGLKYGDEADDEAEFEAQKKAFKPLLEWLKTELAGRVSDGTVSLLLHSLTYKLCSPTVW
jgi:heat shock protein beta